MSGSKTPGQRSKQSLAMSTQTSNLPRIGKVSKKHALGLTFQTEISIKPPFLRDLGPIQGRFPPFDGRNVDLQVAVSLSREMRLSKYKATFQRAGEGHCQLDADDTRRRKRHRSTIFVPREENSLPKRRKVCEFDSASFSTVEDSDEEKKAQDEQGFEFHRRVRERVEYNSRQLGLAAGFVSTIPESTKEVPSTTSPPSESFTRPPPLLPNRIGGSPASVKASDSITPSKGAVQMLAERSGPRAVKEASAPVVSKEHRLDSVVSQARKEIQVNLKLHMGERTNNLGRLGS